MNNAYFRCVSYWHKGVASLFFSIALLASTPAFAGLGASVTLAAGQPTSIYPSETTQLEITLSNNNTASAINSVAFSNSLPGTLPNGLKIAGAATYTCFDPNTSTTSAGSGTLTATVGTQTISLTGGSIPAHASSTDGTCTILIPITAGTSTGSSATRTYTIASGAVTGNDGSAVANSGAVSQSVNVLALALPTISKTFGSSNLILGGASTTLTVTVTNTNPVAIPNFTISDTFPTLSGTSIIQVAGTPTATSTCNLTGTPATFNPSAGDVSLSATGGTIAAKSGATNGTCTITVRVEAKHTNSVYQTSSVNNTITGASFTNDIGLVPANASAAIRTTSPLAVAKAFAHSSIASGQSDTFTVTFTNSSTSALTINGFTDSPVDSIGDLAYGLKLNADPTMTCSGVGSPGTFARTANDVGFTQTADTTVAAGGTCTITANYNATVQTANTPISFTNSIAAGAVSTTTAGVVSQSASASVLVADTLRILKSVAPTTPAPGNPVRYQVTVQNWSNAALSNVTITDALTNSQTFLTGTINSINYTPTMSGTGCSGINTTSVTGDTTANLTITTVPARSTAFSPGSCVVTFWTMTSTSATNGSAVANVLGAGTVCYDPGGGAICNGAASTTTSATVNTSTLSATKSFTPAGPLSEGTVTRMRITLSNLSANPLTSASISDTLPTAASGGGQLRIATPPNAATTCTGSPTITAVANSTSITMNGATVPARASSGTGAAGSCYLQVDVVGPAGTYTNTASAAATETYADGTTHSLGPVTANASLTYSSSLTATKSFSPSAISSGGRSTVTVRLSNAGTVGLTSIAVTDPLPTGMVLANPVNAYSTCDGSPAFTGAAGASSISMSGASLAASGTCDMLFDVTATGGSDWVNTIPVGNITASSGVSNQVAVSGTLTNNAATGVTVAKATSPSTLTFPGQISQMTITLTNGATAVTNLSMTDYFTTDGTVGGVANGMQIAPTPAASTTCTGGVVTANPSGTSVSISGVSLASSASCTISVNVTSTTIGGITNIIPASSISTDQGLTNSGAASTSLTTQSNLGITKQFTPNLVEPGERSRLRITFYNATAQPVTALGVTDTLPSGVTVPAGPGATTTCTGATVSSPASNQVQIAGGSMAAASGSTAASCYAEIDVVAAAEGVYTNTIAASAVTATIGGAPSTNSQPTSDTLRVKLPLVIHKAIDSKTLDAGNPSSFTTGSATKTAGTATTLTIALSNPNSTDLTQAHLVDSLPTGLVVATTPSASTTCASGTVTAPASATSISLTGATIPAGSSCTVTVNVLSNIHDTYINTIAAGAVSTFEGVTNDEPTSAELIVPALPTVSKQFSPPVIASGGTSTMTIFLNNDNSSAATLSAVFTDTLPTAPGSVVVASTPAVSKTCPGTVTAAASATSITYASGSLIPAGGCYISVNVTASTAGVHTNNIPINALQTDFGNNAEAANATLTVSPLGYITGKVFRDNNLTPNGTFESGTDTIISGVAIDLYSGGACSGSPVDTETTDSAGNYLFSDLTAGTYSVCEATQPSGTNNGTTTAGAIISSAGSTGTAGTASNPTSTTSQIVGIVLNNDGTGGEMSGSTGNNFAEIAPSSISGTVFTDQNNNGTQNGADTGISGVTVQLLDSGNNVINTQTTDSSGNYSFTNLAPDTYSVREPTQPTNTSNGITTPGTVGNGGTAGTATGVTTVPSVISTIILPPNTDTTENNFAEIPNTRTISGTVFRDGNDDGLNNNSDTGISGVSLALTGTDSNGNAVSGSATTDSNGNYSFTGLPSGTYTINQTTQPASTTNGTTTAGDTGGTATNPTTTSSRIASINLTASNTISAGNNFAEIPNTRTISGNVFYDYNNNGVSNGSDFGINSVTIALTGTDISSNAVSTSTTTDSNGDYSFTGLAPGTYTLDQSAQPTNSTNGTTTAGTAGGTASNPTSTTSRIASIPLTGATTSSTGNNFAEVPGNAPDLTVSKTHAPATFAEESTNGVFTITPNNIGSVATSGTITIVDTLPTGMTLAAAATGTGWTCTGAVGASSVSCTSNTVINGASSGNPISLRVVMASSTAGQTLTNTVVISGGSEPTLLNINNTTTDAVTITATARVSGTIWRDINHNRRIDSGEGLVSGWTVELLLSGTVVKTATTDTNGAYLMTSVTPGSGYQLRFREPGSGLVYGNAITNEQGITPTNNVRDTGGGTVNSGTNSGNPAGGTLAAGDGTLQGLTLLGGDNIIEQSLPLDPEGIVYDAVTHTPITGAEVTISGPGGFNPAIHLVGGTAAVTTGADGMYQFLLMPAAPAGTYTLSITSYPAGYKNVPSTLIPVCTNTATVANLPDPAAIQTIATAPDISAPIHTPGGCPASTASLAAGNQATTQYYFNFNITPGTSANVVNNHIPIDPFGSGDILVTKTTPLVNVNIGQLVPYTITVHNTTSATFASIDILDTIPPGFKYRKGTAHLDGVALEPTVAGRNLTWSAQPLAASATKTFKLMLVVGAGVQPGEYINSARVLSNPSGAALSNLATATVRVIPDPLFDCSEIIGKVFDDKNTNGYQDEGEPGIPNVRMATVNGLLINSDPEGRFHIACAAIPDADRGSNFLLKLDERTLPTGYRLTTENPRNVRITRGKMAKINFGAAIHKVVRIDMRSSAFESGTATLKQEWQKQMSLLPDRLKSEPSVVRIAYAAAAGEDQELSRARLKAVSTALAQAWEEKDGRHPLQIEEELVMLPGDRP